MTIPFAHSYVWGAIRASIYYGWADVEELYRALRAGRKLSFLISVTGWNERKIEIEEFPDELSDELRRSILEGENWQSHGGARDFRCRVRFEAIPDYPFEERSSRLYERTWTDNATALCRAGERCYEMEVVEK